MAVPGCTEPDPSACTSSPLPLSAPLLCPALLSLNLLAALKVTPAGYALLILEVKTEATQTEQATWHVPALRHTSGASQC